MQISALSEVFCVSIYLLSTGGSTLADLHQALEDYLPVLLGLVKDGSQLQHKVQFVWINQEDDAEVGGQCGLAYIFTSF